MGQDKSKPQPGDLIQVYRPLFQHWALYVGNGYVIHVTDEGSSKSSGGISSVSATKAKVKKELLTNVARNNKWRVNNKYDRSRTPRPVKDIIRRAEECIGDDMPYNVLGNNCEHFVTDLRYGEGVSDQVENAVIGGIATTVGTALVGAVALIAMAFQKN